MAFDNWRVRLEIAQQHKTVSARRAAMEAVRPKINFMEPTLNDEGYYRKASTIKDPSGNGKNIVTAWTPVAYFIADGRLNCLVGQRELAINEVTDQELWSWVVSNPISYEVYQMVAERGLPWPDFTPPNGATINRSERMGAMEEGSGETIPASNREVSRSNNEPPPEEKQPDDVIHGEAIDNAIGAAKDLKCTTLEEAAQAAGAANILRDRRLAAEKVAKLKVDPLKFAYDSERNKWLPMVQKAKKREDEIRAGVAAFEASERRRVAAEQLVAIEEQRLLDEANRRAADRAIGSGRPEQPPPPVDEVVIPQAPPRVQPTAGTYKPREKPILTFAVIEDGAKVYTHFKDDEAVVSLLLKLATNARRAGVEVPGTTIRQGTE